ncbi:MAG TPA: putative Ig domain-containing protein [Gaiellaceae bacterium]|nr:putative Ig domain-containing protein [Gaiellaceae bacterium]
MRALLAVAVAAAVAAAAAAPARAATPGRVTIIGDSVLTAVEWNATPLAILEHGIPNLDLEIGVCRKLVGESCPYEGGRVPTLVDLVTGLGGEIGQTVVVEVGYNDDASTFPQAVEQSIETLLNAGVTRILWVNMHVWQQQYVQMNADLEAAAQAHPQLSIVDWASYSANRYSWFQGDGVHLVYDGAVAMATLLNQAILQALAPPPPPVRVVVSSPRLPVARVGRAFAVHLGASGGSAPYRWRADTAFPRGVHLLANGTIEGRPRVAGTFTLRVQATDADGHVGTQTIRLVVGKASRMAGWALRTRPPRTP